tara:strand:- start:11167 stop:18312 length:7146 start_codon:yes stop_codon:yes gene_type:complete
MNKYKFDQIQAFHDQANELGSPLGKLDLKDFAAQMQRTDQQNDWSEGQLPDNFVTKYSRGVDNLMEVTQLPQLAGQGVGALGSAVDSLIGNEEQKYEQIGQDVGQALPRATAGMLAAGLGVGATLGTGGLGAGIGIPLAAAGAADLYAKGYSDTGSKTAGALQAGLGLAAPGIGGAGVKLGLKMLPKALAGNTLARFGAAELGQEVLFNTAMAGSQAVQGENPLTPENLFANLAGSLAAQPLFMRQSFKHAKAGAAHARLEASRPEAGEVDIHTQLIPTDIKVLQESGLDSAEFFNFLVGKNDEAIASTLDNLGIPSTAKQKATAMEHLKDVMRMAGFKDGTEVSYETLVRADKARGQINKAAGLAPEQAQVMLERAGRILGEEPDNLVTFMNLVKANNDMMANESAPVIEIPSASQRGKIQKKLAREADVNATREQMEGQQRVENEQVISTGRRSKVNPRALQDRLGAPEFQRRAVDDSPVGGEVFRFVKSNVLTSDGKISRIGTTDVAVDGSMNQTRFRKTSQMPDEIFELTKQVYPEAFDGENVNVHKLQELEKTRPMFETHVYGQDGQASPIKAEYDQMTHEWFDNLTENQRGMVRSYVDEGGYKTAIDPQGVRDFYQQLDIDLGKLEQYMTLHKQLDADPMAGSGPRATEYYNSISPFDTKQYPVVRIDVTVPTVKTPELVRADGSVVLGDKKSSIKWRQDNLHENLPNTLGWAMVQFVPHPETGETVMFVAEQQSRWGQDKAKNDKFLKARPKLGESTFPNHPLLEHQHKLVLKAAMEEARKRGVTKMVVSDGETAMMTERHDTAAEVIHPADKLGWWRAVDVPLQNDLNGTRYYRTREEAQAQIDDFKKWANPQYELEVKQLTQADVTPKVEQAGGMRQHYDSVLQSAASKMTGSKGESADLGIHKNAPERPTNEQFYVMDAGEVSLLKQAGRPDEQRFTGPTAREDARAARDRQNSLGSPVFKEADGTPKATATGKLYDINSDLLDRVQYSRSGDKPHTAESLQARLQDNLDLEGSNYSRAMLRLGQQLKGELKGRVERAQPGFVESAETFVRNSLERQGLAPELVEQHVKQAVRIVEKLGINPNSKVSDLQDPNVVGAVKKSMGTDAARELTGNNQVLGVAVGDRTGKTTIGVDPNRRPFEVIQTLIHETLHGTVNTFKAFKDLGLDSFRIKHYDDAVTYADSLTPEVRADMIRRAYADLGETGAHSEGSAKYASTSGKETAIEMASIFALKADQSAAKVRETLRYLPEPMREFIITTMRTMKELGDAIGTLLNFNGKSGNQDLIRFNKNLAELIKPDPIVEKAKVMLAGATNARGMVETNAGLYKTEFQRTVPAVEEFVAGTQEAEGAMKPMGFLQRNVAQHQQSASSPMYRIKIPSYGEAIGLLTTMTAKAKSYKNTLNREWFVEVTGGMQRDLRVLPDSKLTPKDLIRKNEYLRVQNSPKLTGLVSEMYKLSNKLTERAAKNVLPYPDLNDPFMVDLLSKFSPEDQAAVKTVYQADVARNKLAGELEIDARYKSIVLDVATIFRSSGVPHKDAKNTAHNLINRLSQNTELTVDELAMPGVQKAASYWSRVGPSFQEFVQSRDRPYFSEMRTGQYLIRYETGEVNDEGVVETDVRSANSKQEMKAILLDLKKKGLRQSGEVIDRKNKEYSEFDVLPTYLIERARNLENERYEALLAAAEPELAKRFREVYVGGEALAEQAANRKGSSNARKFTSGREHINMLNNQEAYINIMSNKISRQVQRAEFNWQMKHEDWKQDPRLLTEVQEFGHNVLNSGVQKMQGMRTAAIVSAMGFNVSSALIDATQPLTMGVHMAAAEVGHAKAYRYVADGYIEAFRPTIKDAEFGAILSRADREALLITGSRMEDFVTVDDIASFNLSRQGDGADLVGLDGALTNHQFIAGKVNDMFKQAVHVGVKAAMLPTSFSAQVNNKTMLYVGYRTGKAKGLKGDALYDFARNMMQVTNVGGGRAAQSSFKLKAGQANEAVSMATILTNYPIAAFSQMYGSYRSMLKSSGLNPAQRKVAGKVFAGQVLTQFAFAGTLGFGLDALFELSKEAFGIDAEGAIRESLAKMDESGTLGDVFLNGVMNQLTQTDVAARYSLSGVGGFNAYTGFDAKGIFGATGSFWTNVARLPGEITDNVPLSKMGVVPNGVKKMLGATEDTLTDKNGQTLIDPTNVERMKYFMGFRPKRMSDVQHQREATRTADELFQRERARDSKELMEMISAGQIDQVMTKVQSEVAEELSVKQSHGYNEQALDKEAKKMVRERLLGLIQSSVAKELPLDPLRDGLTGSAKARSQASEAFGTSRMPRALESKRLAMETDLIKDYKLTPKRGTTKAIQLTKAVDELIKVNPSMSRQEATAFVKEKLRGMN